MENNFLEVIEKFGNPNDRSKMFRLIVEGYRQPVAGYVGEIIKSKSINAPYHNFYHTMVVTVEAYRNAQTHPELTMSEKRNLVIAALFHDVNHSQGKVLDEYNVLNSIEFFRKVSKESDADRDAVEHILQATIFPYLVPDEDLSLSQKIMRDSDLGQICTENYLQQNVLGLGLEMGVELEDMLSGQMKFLSSIQFRTEYAMKAYSKEIANKLEELNFYRNVLSLSEK